MKPARAQLIAWGYPQDHKIGGLTIWCRGERTPRRKRILAAQIAKFNRDATQDREKRDRVQQAAEYREMCKATGRAPIYKWTPSVTFEVGVFKAELRGDGLALFERVMDKCRDRPNRPAPMDRIAP